MPSVDTGNGSRRQWVADSVNKERACATLNAIRSFEYLDIVDQIPIFHPWPHEYQDEILRVIAIEY